MYNVYLVIFCNISGLVFAGLGFGGIILMVLYMIYWRNQRLSFNYFDRQLTTSTGTTVGDMEMGPVPRERESLKDDQDLKSTGYNSCTERRAVEDSDEDCPDDHIYSNPPAVDKSDDFSRGCDLR